MNPGEHLGLSVFIVNSAGVRPDVVRVAESDVVAIFRTARVQVTFVHRADGASGQPDSDVTVALISRTGAQIMSKGLDERSLGLAALVKESDGFRGRMAWVFFDRVEREADRHHIQRSRLCGLVVAHEIGHMLLSAGHSYGGLMQATWGLRSEQLEYFTAGQADEIRARLTRASELARR